MLKTILSISGKPGLYKLISQGIDDLSQLKNDFSMIHALVSIIEDLNLNTRIWTKK